MRGDFQCNHEKPTAESKAILVSYLALGRVLGPACFGQSALGSWASPAQAATSARGCATSCAVQDGRVGRALVGPTPKFAREDFNNAVASKMF